jgi:acetyl esterase/lipase
MHPPTEMQPLKLERNLAGLLLISPWVSFEKNANSYEDNKLRDIVIVPCIDQLIPDYVHPGDRNNWSEPSLAEPSWWSGIPVRKILNVYGAYELFRDDIAIFGRTLERAGCQVETVECPLQVHIDCILDAQTGSEVGLMSLKIWEWLSKLF